MTNKYDVKFSMISIDNVRFCNCRKTIEGENFEDAAQKFNEELKNDGLILTGIVQYEINFINIKERNKSCILSKEFDIAVKQVCEYDYSIMEKELRLKSVESCKTLDKYK